MARKMPKRPEKSLFWADQIADEIVKRRKFRFTDDRVPGLKKYVVKSAASVSGVLHIGRLSDTIRCDSVFRALKDAGHKAEFIWTADNVDPLRKIPEGVPKSYREYIGMPVTDIPDPWGCHKSYEEHHRKAYLEVVFKFIHDKMKIYSMREEYLKGTFRKEISLILKNRKLLVDIQNKYRQKDRKLGEGWSPWQPICKQCGRIITPRVTKIRKDGRVEYVCSNYQFKTERAKGCGYEGIDDPSKGNGKLMYKGELAAQWAHWNAVTEGFGKEYQVPGSALWINGEIIERVLGFPMPVPIIYEHLMIDNRKMSASLGNVIYPKDWLEVAPPELLRFFYNKKLMKTRSFSWRELPKLYDDYRHHQRVYSGEERLKNKKEEKHMKRLFEVSQRRRPLIMNIPFEFASIIAQIIPENKWKTRGLEILKKTGHGKANMEAILRYARAWADKYLPETERISVNDSVPKSLASKLSKEQKNALRDFAKALKTKKTEKQILDACFEIAKANNLKPPHFFSAAYLVLFRKERGPRLTPFILAYGRDKVAKLFKKV